MDGNTFPTQGFGAHRPASPPSSLRQQQQQQRPMSPPQVPQPSQFSCSFYPSQGFGAHRPVSPPQSQAGSFPNDYRMYRRILNTDQHQIPNLLWSQEFIDILMKRGAYEAIECVSKEKGWCWCWDSLKFLQEFYLPSINFDQEELCRNLYLLVAIFTEQFLSRAPVTPQDNVYQSQRNITRLDPFTISGITEVKLIDKPKAEEICGATTKYEKITTISDEPKFGSTIIRVVCMDTLELTRKIVLSAKSSRPKVAVLNMTHHSRPGGNWKLGEVSQEESLFLQTGLSRGLEPINYPLKQFSCLYTKDVAMIREGLNNGYAFIDKDHYISFDVISMHGVDVSFNAHERFSEKDKATVRVKCEMMLNVCAQNGADILILGAIGCGWFQNPPGDVAAAFRSTIELYAGRFKEIYFAILDPAVAIKFADVLVGSPYPFKGGDPIETSPSREYPLLTPALPPPTDVSLPVCRSCGSCVSLVPGHYSNFSHPPYCPYGSECKMLDNSNHVFFFMHETECPMKAECPLPRDEGHLKRFTHHGECPKALPCVETNDPVHTEPYIHAAPPKCPCGTSCRRIHDTLHMNTFSHPFMQPCKDSPYDCKNRTEDHMKSFSHLCRYGSTCPLLNNPGHGKKFYHGSIGCKKFESCNDLSEEHLSEFCHPGGPINHAKCGTPWCTNSIEKHRKAYYHLPTKMELCPVKMLNSLDPNKDCPTDKILSELEQNQTSFIENLDGWLRKLNRYIGPNLNIESQNFREIRSWFERLRPIHMCSADVAISMCNMGRMLSHNDIRTIWKNPKEILNIVFSRRSVHEIFGGDTGKEEVLKKYGLLHIKATQEIIYGNWPIRFAQEKEKLKTVSEPNKALKRLEETEKIYSETQKLSHRESLVKKMDREECIRIFCKDSIIAFEKVIEDVILTISKIVEKLPGLNFSIDQIMQTNHTVFTIVGPHHYERYGGGEVVFVMRKAIMQHPDFYMTPCASHSFNTGKYLNDRKPFMGEFKPIKNENIGDYFKEKFNIIDPRWSEAAAKEFICRALVHSKKSITAASSVTLDGVREYWGVINPHEVIEGHLPSLVPMDYVEHVIVMKSAYDKIIENSVAKGQINTWKERYGEDFIEVVEAVDDVKKAINKYFDKPPLYAPTGYSFAISEGYEQFIPVKFKEGERKTFIYFMACGGNFSVSVSGGPSGASQNRSVATFIIDEVMNHAGMNFLEPLSAKLNSISWIPNFNAGCPTSKYVHYVLCIDYDASTLTFKHWGSSTYFNDKVLAVGFHRGTLYRYLSFTSFANNGEPPRIWNLNVEYCERTCNIPPLPTQGEILEKYRSQQEVGRQKNL